MVEFGKAHDGTPLHPGRILLLQAMEPLGISRNQLARDIDVPVGRISDITNGKRGITADTALRLGRYFGTGPELWLRLQAEYDLYVSRTTTWPSIEGRVRILEVRTEPPRRVENDELEDEDEFPGAPEMIPDHEKSLRAPAEHVSDTGELTSDDVVFPAAEPVSRISVADADPMETRSDDASSVESTSEEELGIPPVPGTASRIGSG